MTLTKVEVDKINDVYKQLDALQENNNLLKDTILSSIEKVLTRLDSIEDTLAKKK